MSTTPGCDCDPTRGESCRYCDGTDAEDAELRRAKTSRYRQRLIAERQPPTTEENPPT